MITYAWEFPTLIRAPQLDGQTNVVIEAHWRLTGSDENGVSETVYGSCGLTLDQEAPFMAFADLTPEIVQGWVEVHVDVAAQQQAKHFRSYQELISYSSTTFYGGQLQAIKIRGVPLEDVIRFDQVEADSDKAGRGTNEAEAAFILDRLLDLLDEDEPPTVGVITPFREQQTLESYGYRFLRVNRFNLGKDPVQTLSDRLTRMVGRLVDDRRSSVDDMQDMAAGLASKEQKPCSRCQAIKPQEAFFDKSLKGGLGGYGRVCMSCKAADAAASAEKRVASAGGRRRRWRRRW